VDQLALGDHVLTASGAVRPVRWIGRRSYAGHFIAGKLGTLPVLVQAEALGTGLPRRDLLLAPDHGLALDGVLIPVAALLNRTSIRQLTVMDAIEYVHLELDHPDLLLAEGVAAESFAPLTGRGMFQGADAADRDGEGRRARRGVALSVVPSGLDLPRLADGPAVQAVRARIAAQAALLPSPPAPAPAPSTALAGLLVQTGLPPRPVRPRGQGGRRRRALVLIDSLPETGNVNVLSHVGGLRRLGYQVALAPADRCIDSADPAAVSVLAEAGVECLGAPRHASLEDVLRQNGAGVELVTLYGAATARRYEALVRQHCPGALVMFATEALQHRGLEAQVESRPDLLGPAQAMRREELLAAYLCDVTLVTSDEDAATLRRMLPGLAVHVVPWEVSCANAPAAPCGNWGQAANGGILGVGMVGRFGHADALDAARWLARSVMPLVWQRHPGIELVLAADEAPEAVAGLAGPGVRIVRPEALDAAADGMAGLLGGMVRVMAAPLRFGAGVHRPVLDSLARCLPCVMSPASAEGLNLSGALLDLVSQGAAAKSEAIVDLHRDAARHAACAAAGFELVRRDWSAAAVDAALRLAVGTAASRRRSSH